MDLRCCVCGKVVEGKDCIVKNMSLRGEFLHVRGYFHQDCFHLVCTKKFMSPLSDDFKRNMIEMLNEMDRGAECIGEDRGNCKAENEQYDVGKVSVNLEIDAAVWSMFVELVAKYPLVSVSEAVELLIKERLVVEDGVNTEGCKKTGVF